MAWLHCRPRSLNSMPARPKISKALRRQLTQLVDQRCSYCRSPEWIGIPIVIEHVLPLALGGLTVLENLCLSCYRCNEYNIKVAVLKGLIR